MRAAAVRKLAGEVVAFEEGLPGDALGTGGPMWPHERRRRWRALLETTTRLPDVSAWPEMHLPARGLMLKCADLLQGTGFYSTSCIASHVLRLCLPLL